ncbi:hypothetical protein BDW66DRAFT_129846 [Aspergillus desertorum]
MCQPLRGFHVVINFVGYICPYDNMYGVMWPTIRGFKIRGPISQKNVKSSAGASVPKVAEFYDRFVIL